LIADLLDEQDVAQERRIAASGTIQLDGRVGPVGGLSEKLRAAEEADADLFLVPQSELDAVNRSGSRNRVTTVGVEDLEDALGVLNGQA
jgi:PDZ domain-containing protein